MKMLEMGGGGGGYFPFEKGNFLFLLLTASILFVCLFVSSSS